MGTRVIDRDVVIVGAGPAGMAAAIALCEAGMKPTIIDENPRIGGQIYRQPPDSFSERKPAAPSSASQRGIELRRQFKRCEAQIELLASTAVWGFFPPNGLATSSAGGSQIINAGQCLLAAGAGEYVPPFPGWTLPGVMTPHLLLQILMESPGQQ